MPMIGGSNKRLQMPGTNNLLTIFIGALRIVKAIFQSGLKDRSVIRNLNQGVLKREERVERTPKKLNWLEKIPE